MTFDECPVGFMKTYLILLCRLSYPRDRGELENCACNNPSKWPKQMIFGDFMRAGAGKNANFLSHGEQWSDIGNVADTRCLDLSKYADLMP